MEHTIVTWLNSAMDKIAVSALTAVASFIAGRLWLDVLKPWLQDFFYKGPQLEASYTGEFKQAGTGITMHDHIEVKQKADRVSGTMTVPGGLWGKYEFTATLSNGILRGTFDSVGKTSTTKGSFLLATQQGSSELKGWCIEPVKGQLVNYEYVWRPR